MPKYNDTLDPDEQITTEEDIASTLFAVTTLDESRCQRLSQRILLLVLEKFRPDLIEKEDDHAKNNGPTS